MANLTFTVDDNQVINIANALGYATLANPGETKPQFALRQSKVVLKRAIALGQQTFAQQTAIESALANLPVIDVT